MMFGRFPKARVIQWGTPALGKTFLKVDGKNMDTMRSMAFSTSFLKVDG